MKKLLLIFIGFLIFSVGNTQTQIECGSADQEQDNFPIAFEDGTTYSTWNSVYLANEFNIQNRSQLTSISFSCGDASLLNLSNIKVYIKVTTSSSLIENVCDIKNQAKQTYIESETVFTEKEVYHLVYSGDFVGDSQNDWQDIVFNNAIEIDPNYNIAILIEKENQDCQGSFPLLYSYQSSPGSKYEFDNASTCNITQENDHKPFIMLTFGGSVNSRSFTTQTLPNPATPSGNMIYNVNNGTTAFYDIGGSSGGYSPNQNKVISFRPSSNGSRIKLTLNSFSSDIDDFGDFMVIYDGEVAVPGKVITILEGVESSTDFIASESNGAITVLFYSDGLSEAAGWNFTVNCEAISNCNSSLSTASMSPTVDDYTNTSISIGLSLTGNDEYVHWERSINGGAYGITSYTQNFNLSGLNTTTTFKAKVKRPYCPTEYYYTTGLTYTTANNYYVNDNSTNNDIYCTTVGNNTYDGKSPSKPKLTLANLLSLYTFGDDDTIFIDVGTYIENATISSNISGSSNHNCVIIGATKENTKLLNSGTNKIFEIFSTSFVKVENISFNSSTTEYAVSLGYSNNITIENCQILSNDANALEIYEGDYINIKSNNISSPSTADDLLIIQECVNLNISQNIINGGSRSMFIECNTNFTFDLNRNYICNSDNGIYIETLNESSVNIFNNSFYNTTNNIVLRNEHQDRSSFVANNEINIINNIMYVESEYCIKSESQNATDVLITTIDYNDYYNSSNSNIFYNGVVGSSGSSYTLSNSLYKLDELDENSIFEDPLYMCKGNANLGLEPISPAKFTADQSTSFTEGISGDTWNSVIVGAGNIVGRYSQYYILKKNIDGSLAFLKNGFLNFQYEEEYAQNTGSVLTYNIYDENYQLVLSSTTGPVLSNKIGLNNNSLDLQSVFANLTMSNVLEIINVKGEKKYLRFSKNDISNINCN